LSRLLCAGASATALIGSGAFSPAFGGSAAQALSPANLAQVANQQASATSQAASASLGNPAIQAQIALSAANLAKAAEALKNLNAAQAAAAAASQLTLNNAPLSGSAWNGDALSGLNPVDDTNAGLWINAAPLQKNAAAATATVTQTSANALLTWQSFDLNKGETLVFNQQGNADWTVLNRIVAGPANASGSRFVASPSYILGAITAPGSVYVINPNGIIFGPTAQINVHSLIASSLDVGNPTMTTAERNSFFLNQGITTASGVNASFSYTQADTVVQGDVKVEAGASITTDLAPRTVSPDAGGFVYLIAPNVENDGTITTPAGETLMVAAQQLQLTPNIYAGGGEVISTSPTTQIPTFRAVGVNFDLNSSDPSNAVPWRTDGPKTGQISAPGQVVNTGLIDAVRGVVILNGDEVTNGALVDSSGSTIQAGVISAATSITRNSQIFLDARLQLTLSGGSSIQVLPDENGETIPLSAIEDSSASNPSFVPGSVEMRGNTVDIESGSLVEAPGGSVAVTGVTNQQVSFVTYPKAVKLAVAQQLRSLARIYMAPDSSIDVSGLDDVLLPMSDNLVSFKPFGNEFADQPLQRNGDLRGVELTVDIRQTGTYDGVAWVGTPLADVTKIAGNITQSIDQLLTTGGTVAISSQQSDQIVLRQGSTINVAGGYVRYQGGVVATTNLLTADGQVVNIADADPLQTYVGIAGSSTLTHPHWGSTTSETFVDPLLSGGQYQPGYIEGHDAGGISLNSGNPSSEYALDGTFYAGAVVGEQQAALGVPASAASAAQLASNYSIPTSGVFSIVGGNNLVLESTVAPLSSAFSLDSALPGGRVANTLLSTDALSDAGFGQITAKFAGNLDVAADADLTVAAGGGISITAGSADIAGDLTAHSGTIAIQTNSTVPVGQTITVTSPVPPDIFNLTVGPHAVLDASGLWANDAGASAETLTGGAFVNGGSVSLATTTAVITCTTVACANLAGLGTTAYVDLTGNVVLSEGSLLNVSSGGRIGVNGQFQLDSKGRAVGNGGNVSLRTYVGGFNAGTGVQTTSFPAATIVLAGSNRTETGNAQALDIAIHGYGFAQGGALSIQAPTIQIGGAPSAAAGALSLPANVFDGNGFGQYSLASVTGGITVAANATVTLRQRNLIASTSLDSLPTGSNVTDATGIGYLPAYIRSPVNLSLSASLPPLPTEPYTPPATTTPLNPKVALLIGAGASIQGDPGAAISLAVAGRSSATEGDDSVVGDIVSQVGVAEILGSIKAPAGKITITGGLNSEVWLGADSRLDVSGIVLRDSRQLAYRSGTVLPGGAVSIVTEDATGSLVGLRGASIDASGAAGTFDIAQSAVNGLPGVQFTPTAVWSDAGSITLAAGTLLYDGTFHARPGAAEANGGSLTIGAPTNDSTISVQQKGSAIPAGLTPTKSLAAVNGTIQFDAVSLTGSGIANLTLAAGPTNGQISPGTVHFSSGVNIAGLDRLVIDASTIAIANIPKSAPADSCSACLSADYFEWQGSGNPSAGRGTGILTVNAGAIDIAAGGSGAGVISVSGAAAVNFISSGDIRLLQPLANAPVNLTPDTLLSGQLIVSGDLTLRAAQVYPATDVDFTLKSAARKGRISILGKGKAGAAPLSAGGQVTIDAATIVQDGTLIAPLGVIRLGAVTAADLSPNDDSGVFVATQKVTLGKGSVTSVSLGGLVVPFGETADDKNWSYDSQNGLPLSAAPAKAITLSGAALNLRAGSTVDLGGGGDIQAMEFVNGTGGTRDVLAGNANVYAIIPGYNPAVAPIDYDFDKIQGDTQPLAGSSVYLTASPGLPAGYYTLLPPHYATLPGAYRVQVTNTQDAVASQNIVLPDGTLQVAGYVANATAGTRAARTTLFEVQSQSVWRQYSEIDQTSGNSYFAVLAQSSGSGSARLPIDAGHLVIDATGTAALLATLTVTPATGGRGSEVDIAGTDIEVLGSDAAAASGYVGISADQLTALGADSILIGGVRTDGGSDDETITPTAESVEISTDAAAPLIAPEIILVTGTPKTATAAAQGVVIDKGGAITGTGTLAANDPTNFVIADGRTQLAGDSAFLAVSSGGLPTAQRVNASGTAGNITIGAGVTIGGGSLALDARGNIAIASSSTYAVQNIGITSAGFSLGAVRGKASGTALSGNVLAELGQAQSLTLQSLGSIAFFGAVNLDLAGSGSTLTLDSGSLISSGGGAVTLAAGTVDLVNTGAAPTGTASAGSGQLAINANDIVIDAGAKLLSGFAAVTIGGAQQVTVTGAGSLDAGAAALAIDTPRILVTTAATQTVTTTGAAVLASASGTGQPTGTDEIGGTFTLDAGAITDSTMIQATAGGVTLEASTGDVTLASTAQILATGYARTFFDLTRVASGGMISLIADQGSIVAASGSRIDVSSAAGQPGTAGSVSLIAANGNLLSGQAKPFDTAVIAGDTAGDGGGQLTIDAQSIGTSTLDLPSLYSNTVSVEVHGGDLQLGAAIDAQNVTLTVDAGTLTIGQTIDASGAKGGSISLFGGRGVVMTSGGKLLATASDPSKHGGDIVIGTEVASENGSANDGIIDLEGGTIDVANTADATMGGTVRLRAPLTAAGDDVAIDALGAKIDGATSVTVEAFKVFTASAGGAFDGTIDPANNGGFFGSCTTAGVCSGTLVDFVENFALSAAAQTKFASIPENILHLQPGIELVNDDPSLNGGAITVASAWNMGAGIAGDLVNLTSFTAGGATIPAGTVITDANGQLLSQYAGYTGQLGYLSGVSQIAKLFYRVGGSPTGEAGALTLRAVGDINIDASISDGFFQTQDRLDQTYIQNLYNWVAFASSPGATTNVSDVGGYIIAGSTALNPVDGSGNPLLIGRINPTALTAPPLAPYVAGANAISPVGTTNDPAPVAGADLFPLIGNTPVQSWSYRIAAGANAGSANPLAVAPLSTFAYGGSGPLAGHGNVTIDGGGAVRVANLNSDGFAVTFEIPTIVRTGTGSIDIAAGRDFVLANTEAPGVVYTAGRSSVALPDPGYKIEQVDDPLNPGQTIKVAVATDPSGFLSPDLLTCDPGSSYNCNAYGPITAAAYPVDGGHLTISAQQDILGYENPTVNGSAAKPNQQYFAPWLLSQGTSLGDTEFGVFSTLSGYVTTGGNIFSPSQTSWWINFGSFDQGVMSVGGDVRIVAGRDISQLGVSLPTTARVSGGLSNTIVNSAGQTVANVPVVNLNASGDLTVIAGRNIDSGAYYEGSGQATITAGGSVAANWSAHASASDRTTPLVPVSTVLAVDTGQITLVARGPVDIAGVVSAASLQNVADLSGTTIPTLLSSFISSYGPTSAVAVQSISGDVAVNSLASYPGASTILIANSLLASGANLDDSAYRGVSAYPASFEAASLSANVTVEGSLQLAPSNTGTLNLLAEGSLITESPVNYLNTINNIADSFQAISTGPSLVEATFDATAALAGFGPGAGSAALDLGPLLLHQGDSVPDRFYAATGDIISGQGQTTVPAGGVAEYALSWEISKTAQVHAGLDIVDLPFFGQNLAATDVTQIIAGRDIYYTGALPTFVNPSSYSNRPDLPEPENPAGLSLAGPGFFDVEAGRNLGPFVTAAADNFAAQNQQSSDATGTGIITFGNNVTVGNRLMTTSNDQASFVKTDDPFATGENSLLPRRGADIVALFGVGKGVDYQAVINGYIDPATSSGSYSGALVAFLQTLGLPAQSAASAWTTFQALPAKLQDIFVDQVYFKELQTAGVNNDSAPGYKIVDTLFPASYGYTNNQPTGDSQVQTVATGDLEMLHATIKTLQSTTVTVDNSDGIQSSVAVGGDVTVMGPGGNITVGSQAVELNTQLTASALGILTLDNGTLDIFIDDSLLVNQSRVLTVQGGDVTLWSSNGDLDAGKGAKTTVDFKPLSVNFDPSDLQTINLNGLVSGAGIGTIQSTPDAPTASVYAIAFRGTFNAGDAGARGSGSIHITAARCENCGNINTPSLTSNLTPQQIDLATEESASNSAAAGDQAAEDAVAEAASRNTQVGVRQLPSLITVEVLGFGDCDPDAGQKCQE
jgi:filamentous hemagglutinin family protein